MELLQLRYFQKVAELESVTKAARYFSIPQPSMSQAIARLERDLNTRLFERRNGKLFLPISFKSSYTRNPLTTFDDQPNDDVDAFYRENAAQIQAANAEMMRPLTR